MSSALVVKFPTKCLGCAMLGHMNISHSLLDSIRRIVRPLVKLMLAKGITFTMLVELLKEVFVEVAENEFRVAGREQTDSRITLLTGVHRKDVRRLRSRSPTAEQAYPDDIALSPRIVSAWTSKFCDKRGKPKPLPRYASQTLGQSFEALVETVSRDIRARAVLDEWLRLGAVTLDKEDRVCLNTEAFIPSKGFQEKLYYLQHSLHDHIQAGVNNLLDGPPLLERMVFYDSLSSGSVEQLAELSEKLASKTLVAVNDRAAKLRTQDSKKSDAPKERITFGVYFYREPLINAPPHPKERS